MSINNTIRLAGTLANKLRLTGTLLTADGEGTPGVTSFIALTDTPNSYEDKAGYVVVVNDDEDGLEFTSVEGGIEGPQGPAGDDGLSAYEIAVQDGFVGNEAAWLASLVGAQGEQGIQGEQGEPGTDGDAADIAAEVDAATELDPPTDTTRLAAVLDGVLRWVRVDALKTAITDLLDTVFAPIAQGVTNGDAHDHSGGDGGTIAYASLSGAPDIAELARDALGTALTAGAGITVTPDDGLDTITVASTITQYTDAQAQDVVDTTVAGLDSDDIGEGATNLYATDINIAAIVEGATAKTTLVGGDNLGITDSEDSFVLKKLSWSDVVTNMIAEVGFYISGLTAKTTPVDADAVVITDSAASGVPKRVTYTNVKAFLKTYFDTVYTAINTAVLHSELIATSAGAGDAGKPIKLDAAGKLDVSLYEIVILNDSNFMLFDSNNNTRTLQFQLNGITAGQNRLLTVPDASGTIPLPNVAQTWSAVQTFSSGIAIANETLSVFDTGTWAVAITSSATQPTMSYTIQEGTYWRFNNLVLYTISIAINSISVAGTGTLRISLPIAAAASPLSGDATCRLSGVDIPGTSAGVTFNPTAGQAYGTIFVTNDNAAPTSIGVTALANGDAIIINGHYIV